MAIINGIMKQLPFLFSTILALLIGIHLNAQRSDSVFIKKGNTCDTSGKSKYSKTLFKFFNLESKQPIDHFGGGVDVNGIFVLADTSGKVTLYLSNSTYRISARAIFWLETVPFKLEIDPACNYEISIYLSPDKEPIK